jgi:hypothetical protein
MYFLHMCSIARNDLQPEGCRILLGAMTLHPTLTAVDVSDNMLSLFHDKQGYMALVHLIELSTRLCWLKMSSNPLTSVSVSALKNSLAVNHSLTCVFARGCGIPENIREELMLSLAEYSNGNEWSDEGKRRRRNADSVLVRFDC